MPSKAQRARMTAEQREAVNARERARKASMRDEMSAQWKLYYAANRDAVIARTRAYKAANVDKTRERNAAYARKKLAENSETIPYLVAEADRLEALGNAARCREFAETITYDQAWISDRLEDFVCKWLEELD